MHHKDLLKNYLEAQLSEEEFEMWMEALSQTKDPGAYGQLLKQLWEESEKTSRIPLAATQRMLADFQRRRQEDTPSKKQVILQRVWYSAAAIAGLMVAGMALWLLLGQDQRVEYTTGYGETRTLILPDNSTIILNANSYLSYQENWEPEEPREVWLEGEAFFSVVHTQNHQQFRVNVSDQFKVEVLGTEFNVKDRREKAQVVLNAGKVRLDISNTDKPQTLTMQPGDLVEFSGTDKTLVKKQVNPELYAAWRHHKMMFEKMPLQEIAKVLEDNYGVSITIEDTALANTQLTGAFPTHNLNMILTSLPTIIDMEIIKNDDEIIFKPK